MTTESPESTEQRCGHGRLWTDGQHYDPPLGMFAGWRPCDSPPSPSDAPSDEARCTGSPTGKHTPDRMCRYCGLCGLPTEPAAAPPVVGPDALIDEIESWDPDLNPPLIDWSTQVRALRGERDEALASLPQWESWSDDLARLAGVEAGPGQEQRITDATAALAASLDRVREALAESRKFFIDDLMEDGFHPEHGDDYLDAYDQFGAIFDASRTASLVAAALSPGEPPKEGNGHD